MLTAIVLLAVVHAWHGQRRAADPDEFQTLVNAFDSARGLQLYTDFWDNHGPLTAWLFEPWFLFNPGSHAVMFGLRAAMWLITIIIAALLYKIATVVTNDNRTVSTGGVLFLLASPPFLFKALEIRGDNIANALVVLAVLLTIVGVRTCRTWLFMVAGISLGLLALTTLKVLMFVGVYFLLVTPLYITTRKWPSPRQCSALFAGGIVPIVCAAPFVNIEAFYYCVVKANVAREYSDTSANQIVNVAKKAPVWFTLAFGSLLFSCYQAIRLRAAAIEVGSAAAILLILVQFIFMLPTKNMQSLLPLFLPLSLIAGLNLSRLCKRLPAHGPGAGALLVTAACVFLALIRDQADYCNFSNKELPRQVSFADKVLSTTQAEDRIFDPTGIVFLKPKPGHFHVLVSFVRDYHNCGRIDLEIIRQLAASEVNSAVISDRALDLRPSDLAYLHRNYTPVFPGPDAFLAQTTPTILTEQEKLSNNKIYKQWQKLQTTEDTPVAPGLPPEWFTQYQQLIATRPYN